MGTITLRNLTKSYGRGLPPAVRGVDLAIADGEFMVLLGPSGCGKSTTLRMIAGLESITDGELLINERVVNGVPAKDRDIAMVFQSYALYPHMTVYENMAFSLRRQRVGRTEIDRRVRDAAASLGLAELLQRRPHALSGGQRQRVALGRAIVRDPQVFLFDEPLSNLDAALRHATRNELIALHQRLGVTMVYVTHDQIEAMSMGSRIAIMNKGELVQVGRPLEVYRKPADTFVARFLGSPPMNLLPASRDGQALRLDGSTVGLSRADAVALGASRRVLLGVRPEDVYEDRPPGQRHLLALEADVVSAEALGAESLVSFRSAADAMLTARVPRVAHSSPGQRAVVWIDLAETTLFDAETTRAVLYRLSPAELETSDVGRA